jgi:glycosyltransferase involved in cell wall biosynthesis
VLGWARWFDAPALWTLRRLLLGSGHDLVHVWRLAALRAVAIVAPQVLPRVVVRSPLPRRGRWSWFDRQALRRVRCVALAAEDERESCMQQGLRDFRWQIVPPAVVPSVIETESRDKLHQIACVGRLERFRGGREAIWAIDVIRHVFPDAHLCIAGSGPRRPNLQAMIDGLRIDHARLLADQADLSTVLASAAVCWVPSRADRGRQSALEAMASGCVVVASDVPCLRALIRDGETGCLVPPGQPVALARRTYALFRDPGGTARLGKAAQADVQERFSLERVAARWHGLYHELVESGTSLAA